MSKRIKLYVLVCSADKGREQHLCYLSDNVPAISDDLDILMDVKRRFEIARNNPGTIYSILETKTSHSYEPSTEIEPSHFHDKDPQITNMEFARREIITGYAATTIRRARGFSIEAAKWKGAMSKFAINQVNNLLSTLVSEADQKHGEREAREVMKIVKFTGDAE